MKSKLAILAFISLLGLIPAAVLADPWSAIDSGFAVTTNHHGEDIIPPGDPPLRAKVGLLASEFPRLIRVEVELRDPDEVVVDTQVVLPGSFSPGTSPGGNPITVAWTDPFAPASWTIGHYSVKAYFYLTDARDLANAEDLDAMRAVTVMTVPELPTGTLGAVAALFAGLGIYSILKSKRTLIPLRV